MYAEMEQSPKRREKRRSRRAMEEEVTETLSKRRKFYGGGEVEPAATGNSASTARSTTDSGGSGEHEAFSSGVVKRSSSDLENGDDRKSESLGTEIASSIGGVFSREATPTSELQPRSPSKKKAAITRRKIAESTPSAAELEEFFSAAEKYQQKVFAEKYNYDISKDVPLEGKYDWVRLHH